MKKKTKAGYNPDCPCIRTECEMFGMCVECIQGHMRHRKHLPECMQDIVRGKIRELAGLVEFSVNDERPALKKKKQA
jgi:hypothetical protein